MLDPQSGTGLPGVQPMSRRRSSLFFWALVALSLVTLGVGIWQWQAGPQLVLAQSRPASLTQAQVAPNFRLSARDGKLVQLGDFRGQVVLLNFWATWCPPCQAEMPDLDALHRQYGQERGFTVLGVDVEESPATVEAFLRTRSFAFPILLDTDGQVSNDTYTVRSLPMSIIIDRQGNIRDTWTGQISREATLSRLERVW